MSCPCEICTESREIQDMISRKDVELLCKKVQDLHERLLHESLDHDVLQAFLKGDWPRSVEILEAALKKAKEKNESKENR